MKNTKETSKSSASSPISLPAIMDISASLAILESLQASVSSPSTSMQVDASNVQRISTPGLQLLISLSKSAQAAGKTLQLVNASSSITSAADDLGISPYLTYIAKGA